LPAGTEQVGDPYSDPGCHGKNHFPPVLMFDFKFVGAEAKRLRRNPSKIVFLSRAMIGWSNGGDRMR